jgi:hypothetical protein
MDEDEFAAVMQQNLDLFDSAKYSNDYLVLSDSFQRIAEAQQTQWLPYYYAGLALCTLGWMDMNLDKDANADKINALCDKAESLEKSAEICALRNMAATQQMMVDPQSRWMSYGQQASAALELGMKLDPNNPRLYYLQGMSIFGTPEQFGGGKTKAKPIFEKAVALFNSFQAKPLYPNWGQKEASAKLAECE